jgi:hypothetical protein
MNGSQPPTKPPRSPPLAPLWSQRSDSSVSIRGLGHVYAVAAPAAARRASERTRKLPVIVGMVVPPYERPRFFLYERQTAAASAHLSAVRHGLSRPLFFSRPSPEVAGPAQLDCALFKEIKRSQPCSRILERRWISSRTRMQALEARCASQLPSPCRDDENDDKRKAVGCVYHLRL